MVKKLNDIKPLPDDDDDDQPELDMSKPLGVQANARTNGRVDLPDSERELIKPIMLTLITPDPAQPRKAIPPVVSKAAKQDGIPEWQAWHRIAEALHGQPIDIKALLRGESEITPEEAASHPLVKGFLSLAGLAASINRDKLTNAITVVRVPGMTEAYEIETGERRWQAHRMLHAVLGKERFGKIKARIVEKASVWRQATENGVRDELTAIGKARQMALLLMEWYGENKGVQFLPYREIVGDNECNRAFYAQVADGLRFKVPDGHGDSFLQAIGLKSKSQLSRYRALLELPDELWVQADEEDWAEFKIRTEMEEARLPTGNHSAANAPSTDAFGRPVYPPMSVKKGEGPGTKVTKDKVLYRGEVVEYHNSDARGVLNGFNVLIMHFDQNEMRTFSEIVHSRDIKDLPHPERGQPTGGFPSQQGTPFVQPKLSYDMISPNAATRLEVGQRRQQASGRIIEIISVLANEISYSEISPATGRPMGRFVMSLAFAASLPIVGRDVMPTPQVPDEEDEEPFDKEAAMSSILGDDTPRPPAPVKGTYVKYWEYGKPRAEGTVTDFQWRDAQGDYLTLIQTDAGVKEYWSKHLVVADQPSEAADNPLSTQTPLPEWAQRGKTIIHTPSGTVCEVVATVVDAIEDRWYLRCKTGDGEWGDLVLSECAQYDATPSEPRPRHESLHDLGGVIIIDQRRLRFISDMAMALGMTEEAKRLTSLSVTTPNHARERLNTLGMEGAMGYAWTRHQIVEAVAAKVVEISLMLTENEVWVLEDLAADQARLKE